MCEPEKYTLDRVLKIVRGHAEALSDAGEVLEQTGGKDPEVLAMVGEQALKASGALWAIENVACSSHPDLVAAWNKGDAGPCQYHCLFALPLLALAVEAASSNPQGEMPAGRRWVWCEQEAYTIARDLMAWVKAHEKAPATGTEENSGGAPTVSQPEAEQLMPMEAFEAMADALRPLAHGVRPLMAGPDELSGCYIDQSSNPWKLTQQGEYPLTELAGDAKNGLERLDHIDGAMLHRYLPDWCRTQLSDVREIVDRAAWMLWAGSEAANRGRDVCSDPPGSPDLTASLVYYMVKPAYRELCAKFDDYEATERVAIDQQYEDMGWIKQPNGEWHPTKEMLKEMEAGA